MPKQTTTLSNFSAGELSPKLRGRYDLQFFPNGCEKLKNFIAETQGPARFRNGFRYVNNTYNNAAAVLIPFEFNAEQAYILEFTDTKMRIYKDRGIVTDDAVIISAITKANPAVVTARVSPLTITGATKANPCVVSYTGTQPINGETVTIASVAGMTQLNGNTYTIGSVSSTTFTLVGIDSSAYGVYTSGGTAQPNVHRYSNGDEIFVSEVVGMTEVNFHGPYYVANKTDTTFQLATDFALSVFVDSTNYTTYTSGGIAERITTVTHPYAAADLETLNFAQTADTMYLVHPLYAPRKLTRLSHYSWSFDTYVRTADPFTTAGDYPAAVAFYEQRIVFGGTLNDPQKLFFSKADNYSDHTIGTGADDAMEYTIASEKASIIRWLAPTEKQLVCGTTGGTFKITGGDTNNTAITPTNISIRPSGSFGCSEQPPVRNDDQLVFIQRGQRTARSYEFDVLQDGFVNVDRTLLADHIFDGVAKNLALQTGKPDIIWASQEDGILNGLTYKVKEQVSGWHRHTTGPQDTHSFEWAATLPVDTGQDQLWVVTQRTIDGVTKRFVEFMEDQVIFPERDDYYTGEDNEDTDTAAYLRAMFEAQKQSFHLDGGDTYDSLVTGVAVTPGAVSGSSVTFTTDGDAFSATDVGREIWSKFTDGRAKIVEYTSATEVTCQIKVAFPNTDEIPSGEWYLTVSSISGLDYLEGETVQVVTDGGVHTDQTISDGVLTLDFQASVIHFGFGYEGFLKTMRVGVQTPTGVSESKPTSLNKLAILFYTTLGAHYGTHLYKLDKMQFRTTAHKMNRPAPLFSGFQDLQVSDDWDTNKNVYVLQKRPLPCIVQMLVPYITVNDT